MAVGYQDHPAVKRMVRGLVVVLCTALAGGFKCQKTGLCSCKAEDGTIDLSPLALNGSARFKDIAGPLKPYVYSWNPCLPFTEGGSCDEVAVCVKNNATNDYYNLGFPNTASFMTWSNNGTLSLQYMVGGGDGNIRVSSIDLICDKKEEGRLEAFGRTSVGFYLLTIHLDDSDCFAAWMSTRELYLDMPPEARETKTNIGTTLLQALLEHWPKAQIEENTDVDGAERPSSGTTFQVPGHTPVIFSEVGGRTLFRLLCCDAGGETEQMFLNETMPAWVVDVSVHKKMPVFTKIPFFLQPHPSTGIKPIKNDMIQVRMVIERVYEKVLGQGSDAGSQAAASNASQEKEAEKDVDLSSVAEERVELLCSDQVLDPNMDLRTVRHFIWKQPGDLTLHYRPLSKKDFHSFSKYSAMNCGDS